MPHSTDAHWLGSWQNFLHCSFQVSLPSLPPFLWLLPLFCLALLFPPIFPSPSLFLSVPPSPPSIPCWISVSSCGCDVTYSPEIKCIRNEPTSVSYSFCVFLIFWPHCTAGGIIVSWPGIAPCSGSIVLTIGSPGKSPLTVLITARWN